MIPPSLVDATDNISSVLLPPILFAHSTSPELLYFIISPSEEPLFVNVSFPTWIVLLTKYPPAIYPPSLVEATELIISELLPPILFAHSTSPELLYFIINPSEPCMIYLIT